MRKIHTRIKRHHRIHTHLNAQEQLRPGEKVHKPKTFSTEQSAKDWTQKNQMQSGTYQIRLAKHQKRFQVVVRP